MRMSLRFREGFDWRRVTWGRPDSVPTALCSYCHGALPEVPFMLWNEQGGCVQFCDECVERWVEGGGA
jgi:hypothetical protein